MMTKEQAEAWAWDCAENGTGEARAEYLASHGIGTMAKRVWHDEIFTYGIEYGILIAVAKIFGKEKGVLT